MSLACKRSSLHLIRRAITEINSKDATAVAKGKSIYPTTATTTTVRWISSSAMSDKTKSYEWCVVGAGPAGIAAVGLLLDSSVPPSSLLWIDPAFAVGDLGTLWKPVSSNTTVGLFLRFYRNCRSYEFDAPHAPYPIESLPEKQTCLLEYAAEPLRDITARLRDKVDTVECTVQRLREKNSRWECVLGTDSVVSASNVVLATGAVPRSLTLPKSPVEIPLATALDPAALADTVSDSDTVAVFGSSHSAIIIIRSLLEQTSVKRVINFFREPLKYALYMPDWILFDNTGLKGETARWSREHLHGDLPPRLERVFSDEKTIASLLPQCTKAIYATGFQRREVPQGIEGLPHSPAYNPHCGIIAPGLFGCGIAYPEQKTDKFGNVEMSVGLWKFMDYLQNVIPVWKQYSVGAGIGQPKGAPGTIEEDNAKVSCGAS